MNKEQTEVINVVQEVLRLLTVSVGTLNPAAAGQFAKAMQACAASPGISPMAATMLSDLAAGVSILASARSAKD